MVKLYFRKDGKAKFIAKAKTQDEAWKLMIAEIEKKGLAPAYYRQWISPTSGRTVCDYGSHTCFYEFETVGG